MWVQRLCRRVQVRQPEKAGLCRVRPDWRRRKCRAKRAPPSSALPELRALRRRRGPAAAPHPAATQPAGLLSQGYSQNKQTCKPQMPTWVCRPSGPVAEGAFSAGSSAADTSTTRCSHPGPTSPATSTNSFLLLTTVYTGTALSRALISSGLKARSKIGCAALAAAPWRALTDCSSRGAARRNRGRGCATP